MMKKWVPQRLSLDLKEGEHWRGQRMWRGSSPESVKQKKDGKCHKEKLGNEPEPEGGG